MNGIQERKMLEPVQDASRSIGIKRKRNQLTQKELKKMLHYNPDTGVFIWKCARPHANIGDVAGHAEPNSYHTISVFNVSYKAHRLAWLYMKGYLPKNIDIDHKDQIPWHNWWDNLRLASRQCNMRNCGNRKDNKSGVKGVIKHGKNKWLAGIRVNGKSIHLGLYKDFSNAVCARLIAEQCLGWEGCDSSSPAYQYVIKNIIKKGDRP